MLVPQLNSGLTDQAEGAAVAKACHRGPILLPRFGIIGPGLILHRPPYPQDVDLSLDLVVW